MAQGFTKNDTAITIKDSPNLDAFSRLRVSNPLTVFSNQFTYDLSPLVFEVSNTPLAKAVFDSTNRMADMSLTAATATDYVFMQSYEYIPYQPGRSQLVFITFIMFPGGINNDTRKYVGLGETKNGFFLNYDGDNFFFTIYSSTSTGDQQTPQSDWNLDPLNGLGPSGIVIDFSLPQILVIDFQALYVGRVRFGFDLGGKIVYAHQYINANTDSINYPYITSANLPIKVGMEPITGPITDNMYFICCSVASEGGSEDLQRFGYTFSQSSGAVTVATTNTHVLSLRPRLLFNGLINRVKMVFIDVEIFNNGNQPVYWELCIGQGITGTTTYNDVNNSYSAMEYNVLGTLNLSPSVVIDSGYVAASGGQKGLVNNTVIAKYPITLNASGAHRANGTLSLVMKSLSGNQSCYGILKWKEIR